jgi:hypothetical protein
VRPLGYGLVTSTVVRVVPSAKHHPTAPWPRPRKSASSAPATGECESLPGTGFLEGPGLRIDRIKSRARFDIGQGLLFWARVQANDGPGARLTAPKPGTAEFHGRIPREKRRIDLIRKIGSRLSIQRTVLFTFWPHIEDSQNAI